MSHLSLSTLSSKLFIPHELLREIFSHCSPPTLASVCKVNRACLELASPFLYTHIVLDSIDSVVKLFLLETTCSVPSSPSSSSPPSSIPSLPRLVPLSRIRSFTFFSKDLSSEERGLELPSHLTQSLLPFPPLPVTVLVLNLRYGQTLHDGQGPATVLHLFNPSTFVLRGNGEAIRDPLPCLGFGTLCCYPASDYLSSWDRLSSVVVSDAVTAGYINVSTGVPYLVDVGVYQLELAATHALDEEQATNHPPSFLFHHDLLDSVSSDECFHEFVEEAARLLWSSKWMLEGSSFRLVAWVGSEKEKQDLERATVERVHPVEVVFGEQPGARTEVVVEVHPSRAGRRDREDGWAGKTVESWR